MDFQILKRKHQKNKTKIKIHRGIAKPKAAAEIEITLQRLRR